MPAAAMIDAAAEYVNVGLLEEPLQAASLAALPVGGSGVIRRVCGQRLFRRRLMELGLVPGTEVRFVKVAPLGDPMEIEVRGCRLSVRRDEAAEILLSAARRRTLKVVR